MADEPSSGDDRFGKKGAGYCFDCQTEFPVDKVTSPCPECGGERWVLDPKWQRKLNGEPPI